MFSKKRTPLILALTFASFFYFQAPIAHAATKNVEMHTIPLQLQQSSTHELSIASAAAKNSSMETKIINADEPFNAFGMQWTGDAVDHNNIAISVDLYKQDTFLATIELEPIGDDIKGPLPAGMQVTDVAVVPEATAFQVHITSPSKMPAMNDVRFIYYDTRDTPHTASTSSFTTQGTEAPEDNSAVEPITPPTTQAPTLDIVSRSEWGSDEQLMLKKNGELLWPQEYTKIKAFIIHHTAASNGGSDPKASVRAIYQWHTQVLKWGDIGYNFLIDAQGHIYKGRKGAVKNGQAVIGGHTFNSGTNENFNLNTVGIALLGCYQHDSNCATQNTMTPKMKAAVSRLIATIAHDSGFAPKGTTTLLGQTKPRIIGHRSVDSTLCPGDSVFNSLPSIRASVYAYYQKLSAKPYQAKIADATIEDKSITTDTELQVTEPNTITIQYTNTGRRKWLQAKTMIKLYTADGQAPSALYHKSWNGSNAKILMNEPVVNPGETATFTVQLHSPATPQDISLLTKLFYTKSKIARSNGTIDLHFVQPYAAQLEQTNFPVAAFAGSTQKIEMSFKNLGEKNWGKHVALYINGTNVGTFGNTIHNGETGTVHFNFTVPNTPGKVKTYKIQLQKGSERIPNTRQIRLVSIE